MGMKNWSRARWAWFAISFTLGLYVAGVGISAFVRSLGFAISTAEMFYGGHPRFILDHGRDRSMGLATEENQGVKALVLLLSAELVFAIFIGQTAFLHRRDFDRAFSTWYKDQTPTHRLELERQRGINELHRWGTSAVAFATMAAPTLLGFYAIRRRRMRKAAKGNAAEAEDGL